MDNLMKVSATVISHAGTIKTSNEDNFYMDGRSKNDFETGSVQVSLEKSSELFMFAVSHGLARELPDRNSSMPVASRAGAWIETVMREFKKYHERIKSSTKDIQFKSQQMVECIEEANNLVHSASVCDGLERGKRNSFAGLLLWERKAAVNNFGSSRIYFLRDGDIRSMSGDNRKTERLLRSGIITDEQAEMLFGQFGLSGDERKSNNRKSEIISLKEGDVFLICSGGLTGAIDEDRISEILNLKNDPCLASEMLVREALKNGGEDNITVLVARVDAVNAGKSIEPAVNRNRNEVKESRRIKKPAMLEKRERSAGKMIPFAVTLVLLTGLIYGIYELWLLFRNTDAADTAYLPSIAQQTNSDKEPSENIQTEVTPEPSQETEAAGNANSEPIRYKIQKGDSLQKISKKFYNDPQKYRLIMEANNIEDPDRIQVGQEIVIPPVE